MVLTCLQLLRCVHASEAHLLLQDPEAPCAAVVEAAKVGGQQFAYILNVCSVPPAPCMLRAPGCRLPGNQQDLPAVISCNQGLVCTAAYLQVPLTAEERKQQIADRRAAYCSRHPKAQDPASMDAFVRRAVRDLRRSERDKLRQKKEKWRLAAKEDRAEELDGLKQVTSEFQLGCRRWLVCS